MLKIYCWSGEFLFYLARDRLLVKSSAKWILGVGNPPVFFKCDDCTNWNLTVSFKLYREGKAKGEFYFCWGLSGSKKNKHRLAKGNFFCKKKKGNFNCGKSYHLIFMHPLPHYSPLSPVWSSLVRTVGSPQKKQLLAKSMKTCI